jgi:molybdenum cofactor cytidylyltransferase
MRVAAIVLAAGQSRRMGFPKALLPIGQQTFLGRVIDTLSASRIADVYVVLGCDHERILAAVDVRPARVVLNPDWPQGQLSSLLAGLRAAAADRYDAIVMALVDHPLIDIDTVNGILAAFEQTGRAIVLPVHDGRRGHPVLFAARLVPELLAAPADQGARAVVRAHAQEILEVRSPAPGILADIDTPELYADWVGGQGVPSTTPAPPGSPPEPAPGGN